MAENGAVKVEEFGFAEISETFFTNGQICRKLDSIVVPLNGPWHLKPAWNAIYFGAGEDAPLPFTPETGKYTHCQTKITRSALVGPLTPGTWKIYGTSEVALRRVIKTKEKKFIPQVKEVFSFEIARRSILHARAGRYHNSNGACFQYAQLLAKVQKTADRARLTVYIPFSGDNGEKDGVKCRALPQTLAETAFIIEVGKYEVVGPHLHEVALYEIDE